MLGNEEPEGEKLFGVYLGTVADVKDPEKRGRVKVRIPTLLPKDPHPTWALPLGVNYGKKQGRLIVPEVGTMVFVQFLEGNPNIPLWQHGPFGKEDKPTALDAQKERYPNDRVLYQRGGSSTMSVVEDVNGNLKVKLTRGRELKLEGQGTFMFVDTLPNGKLEINRPEPEQKAARKGDAIEAGTIEFTFSPGMSGATLSITYTDQNGDIHLVPSGTGSIPIIGKVTGGSASVKIGN